MMLLIVIAKPLILLLFTEKWVQSVPYFQALCIYGLMTSIIELNSNIIISLGKSNVSLFVRIVQRGSGLILIIAGLWWGMKGMLSGYIISQYISFIIAAVCSGKLMGYGVIKQSKDFFSTFLLSLIAAILTYSFIIFIPDINYVWQICFQCAIFAFIYIGVSKLLHLDGFEIYYQILKNKLVKNNG
jgi:O-antigen/teichoic acid export membrane protein